MVQPVSGQTIESALRCDTDEMVTILAVFADDQITPRRDNKIVSVLEDPFLALLD